MVCAPDSDTQYSAGDGLSLAGGEFSVDLTATQARVGGSCDGTGGADYITGILADGTVVCGTDQVNSGDITSVNAGAGLTGGSTSGDATLSVATGGIDSSMIEDGAVTSAKISSDAVTSAKISSGAVTSTKIADGTITNADISSSAQIGLNKIDMGATSSDFTVSTICPIGDVDGPPCDEVPPGSFCEWDSFTGPSGLDNSLDNCGSFDWYFRSD